MAENDKATASGLLHCLRMLADEASAMQLPETLAALNQAMETCRIEAVMQPGPQSPVLH